MSSIKSLVVVVLAAALVAVACGSDSGDGSGGDGASQPRNEAKDGSSKNGGKDENKPNDKKKNGDEGNKERPAGNVIRVRVAGGRVEGVGDEVDVALGEDVTISVRSDTADEVHVHGYDVFDDVGPGGQAKIELTADIPGAFEVELEDAGLLLFELRVQ